MALVPVIFTQYDNMKTPIEENKLITSTSPSFTNSGDITSVFFTNANNTNFVSNTGFTTINQIVSNGLNGSNLNIIYNLSNNQQTPLVSFDYTNGFTQAILGIRLLNFTNKIPLHISSVYHTQKNIPSISFLYKPISDTDTTSSLCLNINYEGTNIDLIPIFNDNYINDTINNYYTVIYSITPIQSSDLCNIDLFIYIEKTLSNGSIKRYIISTGIIKLSDNSIIGSKKSPTLLQTKISKNILSGLDKNIIGKTSKNNGLNGSINGMGILNVPLSLQTMKNMVLPDTIDTSLITSPTSSSLNLSSITPIIYLPLNTPLTTNVPDVSNILINNVITPISTNLTTNAVNTNFDNINGFSLSDLSPKGSNKKITLPLNSYNFSSGLTVCFYLFINNVPNVNQLNVFSQGGTTNYASGNPLSYNESLYIRYGPITNNFTQLTLTVFNSSLFGTTLNHINNNNYVKVGQWNFISYTISPSGNDSIVTFYVNGISTGIVQVTSQTSTITTGTVILPTTPSTTAITNISTGSINGPVTPLQTTVSSSFILNQNMQLGDRFINDGTGMNGKIRDFIVYNVPLSQANILTLYNNSANSVWTTLPLTLGRTPLQSIINYQFNPIIRLNLKNRTNIKSTTYFNAVNQLITIPEPVITNLNTFDSVNGASFLNNSFINILPQLSNTIFSISFSINLNYDNTFSNRILTIGDGINESLFINSIYSPTLDVSNNVLTNQMSSLTKKYLITLTGNNNVINQYAPTTPQAGLIYINKNPSIPVIPIYDQTWHLISLISTGTNISLYINNILIGTIPITTFAFSNIRFGDSFSKNGIGFSGSSGNKSYINNIFIYNRVLFPEDISILYNTYITNNNHFIQNELNNYEKIESFDNKIIESFDNKKTKDVFLNILQIISIIGLLFYLTILIGNINYDKLLPNKHISFTLNIIFILALMISVIY